MLPGPPDTRRQDGVRVACSRESLCGSRDLVDVAFVAQFREALVSGRVRSGRFDARVPQFGDLGVDGGGVQGVSFAGRSEHGLLDSGVVLGVTVLGP